MDHSCPDYNNLLVKFVNIIYKLVIFVITERIGIILWAERNKELLIPFVRGWPARLNLTKGFYFMIIYKYHDPSIDVSIEINLCKTGLFVSLDDGDDMTYQYIIIPHEEFEELKKYLNND